jgi:hypothetical protein
MGRQVKFTAHKQASNNPSPEIRKSKAAAGSTVKLNLITQKNWSLVLQFLTDEQLRQKTDWHK